MNAIVGMSNQLCGTLMIAKPKSSSDVHHHGEEDTIIYAVKGRGAVVSNGGKTRVDLDEGDFALIPAFTEHQEVNDSDEDVTWVISRGGRNPVVVNLTGWNGDKKE